MKPKNVLIAGAAGRDFHNFLTHYRDNSNFRVVAFTANQIPGIAKRSFPKSMAGRLYSRDIPIHDEERLPELIRRLKVDDVAFSYSDVSNQYIMDMASLVAASGANFVLLGPHSTMIKSRKPVIAICAVRTGSGKSPTARAVSRMLRKMGKRVVVVRHPMPYGDLEKQAVQRFGRLEDLEKHRCTIEEREEYESHIEEGVVVYAGVDYEKILRQAEKEADVVIWDGGNNDFPFYIPDLFITIADARRPGHERTYFHGSVNLRMADYIIINKVRTSGRKSVDEIRKNIRQVNPGAVVVRGDMKNVADQPGLIRNRRVLVVEDGPTLTHGGLMIGAGYLAAKKYGARAVVNPKANAVGSIKKTFEKFPHLEKVLPAMGYGKAQMKELERTINSTKCDTVIAGTPINLGKYLKINKPVVEVNYDQEILDSPGIEALIRRFLKETVNRKKG